MRPIAASSRTIRTARWWAAMLVLPALLLIGPLSSTSSAFAPAPAAEEDEPPPNTFGIGPADRGGLDGRPAFNYAATPGALIRDRVAVVNYSNQPLPLFVYAADSVDTDDGSFALAARADEPQDVASWVTLRSKERIVVPARTAKGPTQRVIPFVVRVPAKAEPGDAAGGVVVSFLTSSKDKSGQNVALEQRVATRMYVRVSGDIEPGLVIRDVAARYTGSFSLLQRSAEVTYTVENTGNARLAVAPDVSVSALIGAWAAAPLEAPLDLLPGATATVTARVEGALPMVLDKATVRAQGVTSTAGGDGSIVAAASSTWFLAVPWLLLVVTALVVGAWVLRRRRRAAPIGPLADEAAEAVSAA